MAHRPLHGHSVTYHYRSHKSERVGETVEVYAFIERMIQHVFPASTCRYYGVQATKTFQR
jgi:hypothetical protein